MKDYLAIFEQADDGSWGAYVPDLPGCTSHGASRAEVAKNIRDAIEFHIEGLVADGEPVPQPSSEAQLVHIV